MKDKETNCYPHNGQLLKEAIEERGMTINSFAQYIGASQPGIAYSTTRESLQIQVLWKLGLALERNLIAEIGDDFPIRFTTTREKELLAEQEKLIAGQNELKREIEKLNIQIEVYKEVLKK